MTETRCLNFPEKTENPDFCLGELELNEVDEWYVCRECGCGWNKAFLDQHWETYLSAGADILLENPGGK